MSGLCPENPDFRCPGEVLSPGLFLSEFDGDTAASGHEDRDHAFGSHFLFGNRVGPVV